MHNNVFINVLGWIGGILVLIAYWLVSTGRVRGNSLLFQSLNICGSVCLIINSAYFGAFPSVGVNVFWIIIAFYSLFKSQPEKKLS